MPTAGWFRTCRRAWAASPAEPPRAGVRVYDPARLILHAAEMTEIWGGPRAVDFGWTKTRARGPAAGIRRARKWIPRAWCCQLLLLTPRMSVCQSISRPPPSCVPTKVPQRGPDNRFSSRTAGVHGGVHPRGQLPRPVAPGAAPIPSRAVCTPAQLQRHQPTASQTPCAARSSETV